MNRAVDSTSLARARAALLAALPLMEQGTALLEETASFITSGIVSTEVPHEYRGHSFATRKYVLCEATYLMRSIYRSTHGDNTLHVSWIVDLEYALARYKGHEP